MSKLSRFLATATLGAALLPSAVFAQITNGTFEAGLTGWTWQGPVQLISGSPGMTAGTVIAGANSVLIGGSGQLSQSFEAIVGNTYNISMQHRTGAAGVSEMMLVSLGIGSSDMAPLQQFNTSSNGTVLTQGISWTAKSTGLATFSIQGAGQNPGGVIDNILVNSPVSAVPEPTALALMLVGLGIVGFMSRGRSAPRQSQKQRAEAAA